MSLKQTLTSKKNRSWVILSAIILIVGIAVVEYEMHLYASSSITYSADLEEDLSKLGKNVSTSGQKLNAQNIQNLTSKFSRRAVDAQTIINAVRGMKKDYPVFFMTGPEIAKAMPSLSKKSKSTISKKIDKVVFSDNKMTVILKKGTRYIKIKDKTKKGKSVSLKIKQGTQINLTENSKKKVYGKAKGLSVWAKVNYADIGAFSIKSKNNTFAVFTKLGVGFWTSHKLGNVRRRTS